MSEPTDTLDHEAALRTAEALATKKSWKISLRGGDADAVFALGRRFIALADEVEALRLETDRLKGREEIMSESLAKASGPPLAYEGDDTDLLFRFGFFLAEHHAALAAAVRYREFIELVASGPCGNDGLCGTDGYGFCESCQAGPLLAEAAPQTETPTDDDFAKAIRDARDGGKWSSEREMGQAFGVSASQIRRWAGGESLPVATARRGVLRVIAREAGPVQGDADA